MPLLVAFAIIVLAQDRTETKGKSYAQILAMGRSKWHNFYVGEDGGVTVAETSAEALYGDALGWRNDQLLKGAKSPLRAHLQAFKNDAVGVGSACTGGGTLWNIVSSSLYADAEEALYAVLTRRRTAPKRVVSDLDKEFARFSRALAVIEEPEDRKRGREAMGRLQKDFRDLVGDARRLPRRDSDTVLEFCRKTLENIEA